MHIWIGIMIIVKTIKFIFIINLEIIQTILKGNKKIHISRGYTLLNTKIRVIILHTHTVYNHD